LVLLATYLPHAAPLVVGHVAESSHCSATWAKHLPLLPGLIPGIWVAHALGFDRGSTRFALAGVSTALLLAGAVWIGSRGPRARLWTALAILLVASGSAYLESLLFAT
jgi:hypothetical protein